MRISLRFLARAWVSPGSGSNYSSRPGARLERVSAKRTPWARLVQLISRVMWGTSEDTHLTRGELRKVVTSSVEAIFTYFILD